MGLFQGFLHPLLLWGAALAAVPLLIHILNRRRHRPLAWGAMRFVLAAHKRTRRRVQLENWLLLFLRMAAVAALAFAISRPFIGKDSPLAPMTEKRRDVVLVLDDSASTAYRDVRSVHEAILDEPLRQTAQAGLAGATKRHHGVVIHRVFFSPDNSLPAPSRRSLLKRKRGSIVKSAGILAHWAGFPA